MKRSQQFLKNRMFFGALFFAFVLIIVLFSCKKDKVVVDVPVTEYVSEIKVFPFFGSDSMFLDSVYTFSNGIKIKFSDVKFYVSNYKQDNGFVLTYSLFDFRNKGNFLERFKFSEKFVFSDDSLSFNFGIPSSVNHNDPNNFSTSSVLNIENANDMHWGWSPGYIFLKIEGKIDKEIDSIENFNIPVSYHIGNDENFSEIFLGVVNWNLKNQYLKVLNLKIDMRKIFDNGANSIDLNSEWSTHSEFSEITITDKIRQNFLAAISVE